MSKIHVVGISGWKRSGKDTAAEQLVEQENFMRVSFADPLKELVAAEYGIPIAHCYEDAYKEAPILSLPVNPKDSFTETVTKLLKNELKPGPAGGLFWTPRALCILKGSSNRAVDPNFWTNQAIKYIIGHNKAADKIVDKVATAGVIIPPTNYVISDLRYINEAEQMKEAFNNGPFKFSSIRVNRFDTIDTTDPSERNLDNYEFDYVIENRKTLEDLEQEVKRVINDIKKD